MRFLAELSGNRFKYGEDFISKTNDYDLVFANYDTEYITRMGGSYELNSVIPAHGNRFAITSAKYTEPFSDEFEIVNLNGVIPENKVGEICEKLFMNGIEYKKLRYKSNYGFVKFHLRLKLNQQLDLNTSDNDNIANYVVVMRTPSNMKISTIQNFTIQGQDTIHLEINPNENISIVINDNIQDTITLVANTIIDVKGIYKIVNEVDRVIDSSGLETYKKNWGAVSGNMDIQEDSYLKAIPYSFTYLNCIFTDPEAIEGGVNGQWGTIGFKFTLTADSQFCWEDKNGFSMSSAQSHTFYSGDAATIIPPKITVTLNGGTYKEISRGGITLYTKIIDGETVNKNCISFAINNIPISIDIPDNTKDDDNNDIIHSMMVDAGHTLKFIIDPKLRQVYGEDLGGEKPIIMLGYPENRENTQTTYVSLASVFTGFKTIPKGLATINNLSDNIQSIQFGDYTVGYLI